MGGRSLGWAVPEKGRRMSGEMRIDGRVEEMAFSFYIFLGGLQPGGVGV